MAFRLVGQNCAVQGKFGGAQDGAPTWDVSATSFKALARRVMVDDSAETADLSALGDARRITQVTRVGSRFELEILVSDSGRQFAGKIGHYFQFEYKALSTESSFTGPVFGVISNVTWEAPDGAQVERITVECDANGAV